MLVIWIILPYNAVNDVLYFLNKLVWCQGYEQNTKTEGMGDFLVVNTIVN